MGGGGGGEGSPLLLSNNGTTIPLEQCLYLFCDTEDRGPVLTPRAPVSYVNLVLNYFK